MAKSLCASQQCCNTCKKANTSADTGHMINFAATNLRSGNMWGNTRQQSLCRQPQETKLRAPWFGKFHIWKHVYAVPHVWSTLQDHNQRFWIGVTPDCLLSILCVLHLKHEQLCCKCCMWSCTLTFCTLPDLAFNTKTRIWETIHLNGSWRSYKRGANNPAQHCAMLTIAGRTFGNMYRLLVRYHHSKSWMKESRVVCRDLQPTHSIQSLTVRSSKGSGRHLHGRLQWLCAGCAST